MQKGRIIVVEGTDSSGKKTQTNLLFDRLIKSGFSCGTMSFPCYDLPTGKIVGKCYLGKKLEEGDSGISWFGSPADVNSLDPLVSLCYYAADRRFATPAITKIINSGRHLILDRYVESNKAHQGGKIKDPSARIQFYKKIDVLEHEILGIPRADKVIFLYMPWQVAKILKEERGGHQDAHEQNDEHLINAEEAYLQLAQLENWLTIDCAPGKTFPPRTKEDISNEVYQKVVEFLQN